MNKGKAPVRRAMPGRAKGTPRGGLARALPAQAAAKATEMRGKGTEMRGKGKSK